MKITSKYKFGIIQSAVISSMFLTYGIYLDTTHLNIWNAKESNCFELQNDFLRINNPLKIFTTDKIFYYNNLNCIKIFNYSSAFNEKRIEIYDRNNKPKKFYFRYISESDIDKFVMEISKKDFQVEYYYGESGNLKTKSNNTKLQHSE